MLTNQQSHIKVVLLFISFLFVFQIVVLSREENATNGHLLLYPLFLVFYFSFYSIIRIVKMRIGKAEAFYLLGFAIYLLLGLRLNQFNIGSIIAAEAGLVIGFILALNFSYSNKQYFIAALKIFLWLSVLILFIQIVAYLLLNIYIDFHKIIYPFSDVSSFDVDKSYGFFRFTGIFLEPGLYATFTFFLTVLLVYTQRKVSMLSIISASSIFLVMGISAFALGTLALVFLISFHKGIKAVSPRMLIYVILTLTFIVSIIYITPLGDYLSTRINNDQDRSAQIKVFNIISWFEMSMSRKLTGSGLNIVDCNGCAFVNSSGLLFSTVFYYGLTGLLLFLLLFQKFSSKYMHLLIVFLAICISRFRYEDPIVWLLIFYVIINKQFIMNHARDHSNL